MYLGYVSVTMTVCPVTETGDKTANINAKTQFITPINGKMAHQKQQKNKKKKPSQAKPSQDG